jgi:hypothetical protein
MKSLTKHISEKLVLTNNSKIRKSLNDCGFEYVDLELPSGNLWAVANIGADEETDFGDYFAWGETESKDVYSWKTYKWCKQSFSKLTKYCVHWAFGYSEFTDNITQLEPEDDAAHVLMKGGWYIPSHEDVEELMNNTEGSWESDYNGTSVSGLLLTGKNKKQLFLPAVGYKDVNNTFNLNTAGYYWISELNSSANSDNCEAITIRKYDKRLHITTDERYYGSCIRPVLKKK